MESPARYRAATARDFSEDVALYPLPRFLFLHVSGQDPVRYRHCLEDAHLRCQEALRFLFPHGVNVSAPGARWIGRCRHWIVLPHPALLLGVVVHTHLSVLSISGASSLEMHQIPTVRFIDLPAVDVHGRFRFIGIGGEKSPIHVSG